MQAISFILALIFFFCLFVVVLSYAMVWYENANRRPELIAGRFAPEHLLLALRLIVLETFFLVLSVLVHPLGWLPPARLKQPTQGPPVLLLHGLFHSRACWLWMQWQLRRRGFQPYSIGLPPWQDVDTLSDRVASKVEELRDVLGADKVHLVGHSMGGIIARHFIQCRGGGDLIGHCVLLGSPNAGSKLVPFSVTRLGHLLLPGSAFLLLLAEAPLPETARLTTIYSRHDNMVLPFENARLPQAVNVELSGMGHTALLFHPRVLRATVAALQEPL